MIGVTGISLIAKFVETTWKDIYIIYLSNAIIRYPSSTIQIVHASNGISIGTHYAMPKVTFLQHSQKVNIVEPLEENVLKRTP